MGIIEKFFGKLPDGSSGKLYKLENKNGMRARITDVGCSIVSLHARDAAGGLRDVVFGFNNAEAYYVNKSFFGCAVGRVANRIRNGEFELDGKKYFLEKNDGGLHHLHGGSDAFNKKLWETVIIDPGNNIVGFKYESAEGEAGYPGKLTAYVTYTLTEDDRLRVDYSAETDSKTICNLTNHTYFNLNGHASTDILKHVMQINADEITETDGELMPTGKLLKVSGTPHDFRAPKQIGKNIEAAGGYDDNFALNGAGLAARVYSPESGVQMEVYTDSPGIQLYTGNFLNGNIEGKDGVFHQRRSGFCLETQLFPDAINQPGFPSSVVTKDNPQKFYTEFAFGVKNN